MKRTIRPEQTWRDLAADLLGPSLGGDHVFVVLDYYRRVSEVDILRSVLSKDITESLDRILAVHGIPCPIRTDSGPQFTSEKF